MQNYIDSAVEQFRQLLTEQIAREKKMEQESGATDFSALDKIVIGLCGGDGIGPVISKQAKRILEFLLRNEIESGKIELKEIEGLTIENRIAKNKAIPDDVLEEIKKCNVILKGPTTTLKGGNLESANVAMRRELDLYANVRPVRVPDENIDWTFFRENTEGEYVLGSRGVEIPDTLACSCTVYKHGVPVANHIGGKLGNSPLGKLCLMIAELQRHRNAFQKLRTAVTAHYQLATLHNIQITVYRGVAVVQRFRKIFHRDISVFFENTQYIVYTFFLIHNALLFDKS